MLDDNQQDRVYDPMIYDVMRELANQVMGRYLAWERQASTPVEAEHWQDMRLRTRLEVRAVNPDSRSAVEAKTNQLGEILKSMPEQAPVLA